MAEEKKKPTSVFKDTLNLPVTRFDMKANLTQREPERQARWDAAGLYRQLRERRAGSPKRVLHDGPPYANGEIHMGHLLNKVLKDFVVRYCNLAGYDSPYVPGWDCHGLPIEHKVVKDLGSKAASMSANEIRALCREEALKWVGIQRDQFRRLGIMGDWFDPYLTLDPRYESAIVDVLADLVAGGYVFRQLKPIHWDIHDRTALAEAELEYEEVTSPSVYVNFPVLEGLPGVFRDKLAGGTCHVMIWTTTPWTLPANVAIAYHPDIEYALVRYRPADSDAEITTVLAASLVEKVMGLAEAASFEILARAPGKSFAEVKYRHVFLDRVSPLVNAAYVSAEDGTGFVHTAPGHGAEDYQTGLVHGLPVISPVDPSGRFTDEAPAELVGLQVFAANPKVVEILKGVNALVKHVPLKHSYPHGWRSKKPVIFRATAQWFISVDHDGLRQRALDQIRTAVKWRPEWGQNRIEAMVSQRPDWCISRQRAWGVPIPAIACSQCEHQHLTAVSARHFAELFREHGTDVWYARDVADLLPPDLPDGCPNGCGKEHLRKGTDILDVWFESGSSHRAVLRDHFRLGFPAYLYLEGSDQHRGWFQSSLLTSVGANGVAPFENVLTHGFIVDDQGRKMSKSLGNVLSAVKLTETYGADIMRLYVASLDYANDIRMSERGIKETAEAYRKIRNTFRFLLGNLEDYAAFGNLADITIVPEDLEPIDRWILSRANQLIRDVTSAFERFEFYRAFHAVHQFASVDLSAFYLDVLKDRLYAETKAGTSRRTAQRVMAYLHSVLVRLTAPLMPHTADEVWEFLPEALRPVPSVHLADWPVPDSAFDFSSEAIEDWRVRLALREEILKALEALRAGKKIGSAQEAVVRIACTDAKLVERIDRDLNLLRTITNVSDVVRVDSLPPEGRTESTQVPGVSLVCEPSGHSKCERCWNLRASVGADAALPTLCDRCVSVIRIDHAGMGLAN
ncbi:isoleucine--tRNA ligase [bacterium]|nr:isoleucine--tRNA ligase [bacterium]